MANFDALNQRDFSVVQKLRLKNLRNTVREVIIIIMPFLTFSLFFSSHPKILDNEERNCKNLNILITRGASQVK